MRNPMPKICRTSRRKKQKTSIYKPSRRQMRWYCLSMLLTFVLIAAPASTAPVFAAQDPSGSPRIDNLSGIDVLSERHALSQGTGGIFSIRSGDLPSMNTAREDHRLEELSRSLRLGPPWGGLVKEGGYIYSSAGRWLVIFDAADEDNPVEVGRIEVPEEIGTIAVSGGFAYIATWPSRLQVIDVSVPESPELIATLDDPFSLEIWWRSMAVQDGYVYICGNVYPGWGALTYGELWVIDVSVPAEPVNASVFTIVNSRLADLVLSGSYIYLLDSAGTWTLDVTVPEFPVVKAYMYIGGYLESLGRQRDLVYCNGGDFAVSDYSDPINPAIIANVPWGGYYADMAVQGNYAYSANDDDGLVTVFDVADSTAPAVAANLTTVRNSTNLVVDGGRAYVADWGLGLAVADISDPLAPAFVGYQELGGSYLDLEIANGHAYVADNYRGIWIVDTADPDSPEELGGVELPPPDDIASNTPYYNQLAFLDDHLYAVYWQSGYSLHVFDATRPDTLVMVCDYPLANWLYDLKGSGRYIYGADYYTGALLVIEVTTPSAPEEVGRLEIPGVNFQDLAVLDDIVAVRTYSAGMRFSIIDVSNPSEPVPAAEILPEEGFAFSYAPPILDGSHLYVFDYQTEVGSTTTLTRVVAYDISDPANPAPAGSLELATPLCDVVLSSAVFEDKIFVGCEGGVTLKVIDISDPANMTQVGWNYMGTGATNLQTADGLAYMTTWDEGLIVVDHHDYEVELTPHGDPIEIPQATGGTITYDIQITNHLDAPATMDAWIDAVLPDSTVFGPIQGPTTIVVPATGSVSGTLNNGVPPGLDTGAYEVRAFVGDHEYGDIEDDDSFFFHVVE